MPDKPGSIGHKPGGSFVNTGELMDGIKKKRELDLLERTKDRVEEDRATEEEKKQDEEITKLLPDKVESAFGEVRYKSFKALYKDVFEAVASKDHWALGYVAHEMDVDDGIAVRVRTLRKREADVLRGVAPKGAGYPGASLDTFNAEQSEYELVRLLFCLQQFGDTVYHDETKITLKNYEEWRRSELVAARVDAINDLPDEVVALIGAVIHDTMVAYRCAMTENLKNRLAPLSDTTASD